MNIEDVAYLNAVENVEEAEILANRGPPRLYESHDPFEESEEQFIQIYRLTKNNVNELIDLMRPFMIEPNRVSALNIERKVLTALRFFGSGSYQMDIGRNLNHAVSQASVSRCIDEVTNALNNPDVFNRFVKLPPSVPELNSIRNSGTNDNEKWSVKVEGTEKGSIKLQTLPRSSASGHINNSCG